jgi:hypothetical protein
MRHGNTVGLRGDLGRPSEPCGETQEAYGCLRYSSTDPTHQVAPPSDVPSATLTDGSEELNSGIARDHGLRLELARWETDAILIPSRGPYEALMLSYTRV